MRIDPCIVKGAGADKVCSEAANAYVHAASSLETFKVLNEAAPMYLRGCSPHDRSATSSSAFVFSICVTFICDPVQTPISLDKSHIVSYIRH